MYRGRRRSKRGGGAIVLAGSIAFREVMPFPAYAASKAALEALCRQSAVRNGQSLAVDGGLTIGPGAG